MRALETHQSVDPDKEFDFVVIGSGFGGSVSAMRLAEKGYSVLVLERGKRYEDKDFPNTNWNIGKSLWLPILRCFGILQIDFLNGAIAFHGSGVGGGSLMYANVLMEPDDRMFESPNWRDLADWKSILRPHYETAKRMLGVTTNPRLLKADDVLREIARERGTEASFRPTEVGVFFGEESTVPDPYFDGEGPKRAGCNFCGGCMVGCRFNAKNTLPKNYLFFAEKWGTHILPETEVRNIRPLTEGVADGARYEVEYRSSTAWLVKPRNTIRARNVVVAAGALGSLQLLFRCRDQIGSLPHLSERLGDLVRTNSENLQAVTSRDRDTDYSKGIAIGSVIRVDEMTYAEPVRYSDGSSMIRNLGAPLVDGERIATRIFRTLWEIIRHPADFFYARFFSRWARYTTILLLMQPVEELLRMRLGRNLFTLFRKGLMFRTEEGQQVPKSPAISNTITRQFASYTNGIPESSFMDSLFNYPATAHLMGGVPFGRGETEGVIGMDFQVHNYPGLYVVDGSAMPGNPGLNPSLTITALAEYAMSQIPPLEGATQRPPLMSAIKADTYASKQMGMKYKSLQFIAERVEVQFDRPPSLEKKPGCPNRFIWNEETYQVSENIGEWRDYNRRGRMAHNMRAGHAAVAEGRGSWGVGRFYFRVRTLRGQVFDLYYDRAPKSVDDRKGAWFLYREMSEIEE